MKKTRRCRDTAVVENKADEGMRGVEANGSPEGGREGEGNPGETYVKSGGRREGRVSRGERSMEEVGFIKKNFKLKTSLDIRCDIRCGQFQIR